MRQFGRWPFNFTAAVSALLATGVALHLAFRRGAPIAGSPVADK